MKNTKIKRFLPILVTLLIVIVLAIGITATAAEEVETRSNQITHANIVLDNDVDLVFWADVTEADAARKSTYMVFNDEVTVYAAEMQTLDGVTYATFTYTNIMPKDLVDVVNAKLYVNGVYTSYIDYSVKDYCQYILTNSTSSSLKTLVSDLLVYGAAAQTAANEGADTLVTNGIVGLTPSANHDEISVLFDPKIDNDLSRGPSAELSNSKLLMDNGLEMHFNVELPEDANPSDYMVCLTVNGREQEVPIMSKITLSGYESRVSFKGIYSYELFDEVQVNVYKNSVRVSETMTFSVAAYLNALNKVDEYTALTNAFYNYCYSSHIYAGTHTILMPGELTNDGVGNFNAGYDDSGKITYNCSLCGQEVKTLTATHVRNFDSDHTNGSPANGTSGASYFTMQTLSETVGNGAENNYLSIAYDSEKNKGTGTFGYYFLPDQSRPAASAGVFDVYNQYTGTQFTFTFDIKAPSAGLAQTSVYLRNTNASSSSSDRFGEILTINPDGSMVRGSTKIAPHSTITRDKWSTVTVTMDFYTDKNGDHYIFLEYYVDSELMSSFSIANPMRNYTFTCMYLTVSNSQIQNGQGVLFDNMAFAQGLVHSFSDDVPTHLAKLEGGNLRKLIDMVQNDFDVEDFSYVVRWDGKSSYTTREYQGIVTLDRNKYKDPLQTPKSYDHPRVLFNSKDVPQILANMEAEENAVAKTSFMALVNTSTDGKLQSTDTITPASFEWTNYNTSILRVIEAKALFYAIYKDSGLVSLDEARLRGYEAIYAMKNYLLTFDVQWKASDQCRYYGELMYYSALVYDWCYDLLTEEDKTQFILGVQNLACDGTNNMPWAKRDNTGNVNSSANGVALNTHEARKLEGGFPALAKEEQNRLTGHGAEAQVLRDYFSFAIAIYDEESSWYDYVGGLVYQDYIEPRNYFYSSGFYPDGSAGYAQYRFLCDMYNAWLFKGMGVDFPYNEEDMSSVIHGLMSMETVDGYQFATADGTGTSWNGGQYRIPDNVGDAALISAYIFNDPAALAGAHYVLDYRWLNGNFSNSQLCTSAANYLILTSNDLTPSKDYQEKIQNVEYHGGFQQQIVTRNSKDEDSVVVLMQGAQFLPGGHTHQNAGNFQIWYKGMLTRDDGLYDAYGSDHHHYYHMAAVAHNTLLIYNPKRADMGTEPVGRIGYYNGGQRSYLGIPTTYKTWINDDRFSYGKLIGWETDSEDDPSYVYFANDLTNAYESDTVDYVERSFMTVYTDDPETPMVMFVFDNITADDPSFQKTFLLQCATAPTVDTANSTVTVDNGEGKLVLTSLLGNDTINAYGRTSKGGIVYDESAFLIADKNGKLPGQDGYVKTYNKEYMAERFYLSGPGKNLLPGGASSIGDRNSDLGIVWGHVEIQPEANQATNQLMNVLYVADSGTTVSATPRLIEGSYLTGATFKNYTSVFLNDTMHSADSVSFTATADDGIETMTYYVGGLADGEWTVYINGEQVYAGYDDEGNGINFTVSEEGRMLTFTGAVGEVTIEPDESMRPKGSKALAFNLNGGKWVPGTEPAPYYIPGETTVLPVPTKKDSEFGGWYLDKNFSGDPITEIPLDMTEALVLYAKWSSPIMYADYTKGGTLSDHNQVTYSMEAGGGTTWGVVNDENESYFLWTNTGSGSIIQKAGAYANYATQSMQVSYTFSLGRNGTDPLMPLQLYFRDDAHNRKYANLFWTDAAGNVFIGDGGGKTKIGEIASSGISTFHFVLDFATGTAIAYDDNGVEVVRKSMSSIGINKPSGTKDYADWYKTMTASSSSIFALKGAGAGTIRIYRLQMLTGNLTENCKNFGTNSDMHTWDEGQLIGNPSDTDCTPGSILYTCKNEKCGATKSVALPSSIAHQEVEHHLNASGKLEYECLSCHATFTPGASYYLDGLEYGSIVGVGNANHFTTKPGTNLPVINSGSFELINKTGELGNIELWVPGRTPIISGFSPESNAIGFASFKINALTTNTFDFNFVDTSSDAAKWSPEWCITDSFLRINAPHTSGGKTTVKVTGWDGIVLKTIEVQSDRSFTGWIDVSVYIEFNDSDEIVLHYYIDGQYTATVARELTTKTNAINSICVTGSTSALGSGIKFDEIAFGYTADGAWTAPKE